MISHINFKPSMAHMRTLLKLSITRYNTLTLFVFSKFLCTLFWLIMYFPIFTFFFFFYLDRHWWKTFDAVVGDITILANRSHVEFTQPYIESGLSMVIPIRSEASKWMFVKPFTWEMWAVTGAVMAYTMLVVWFLEHPTNPKFSGTLKNQIGTTIWFTFSSLFFAQSKFTYTSALISQHQSIEKIMMDDASLGVSTFLIPTDE